MRSNRKVVRAALGYLAGVATKIEGVERREAIYSQGDVGKTVIYILIGGVKLSAATQAGKEAVVAILGPGAFFGEECLSGRLVRCTTAIAIAPSTLVMIRKNEMRRVLRTKLPFCDVFISYLLARNIRIEEDLMDSRCNGSEVRLARVLLQLAEEGDQHKTQGFAEISQGTLARMIGTTRSRVNFFMHGFRQRGFINYVGRHNGPLKRNEGLHINISPLTAFLHK